MDLGLGGGGLLVEPSPPHAIEHLRAPVGEVVLQPFHGQLQRHDPGRRRQALAHDADAAVGRDCDTRCEHAQGDLRMITQPRQRLALRAQGEQHPTRVGPDRG